MGIVCTATIGPPLDVAFCIPTGYGLDFVDVHTFNRALVPVEANVSVIVMSTH